jgi:CDP-2,3-bis-(O-geranylgeranyl)-sn-glycerol synthase
LLRSLLERLAFRLFFFDTLIFFAALYTKLLAAIPNIDSWFFTVVSALWIMLPAYVPNPAAVILGGGPPIDGGASWRDGRRLFGDGKTVRGFTLGILAGVAVGGIELWVQTAGGIAPWSGGLPPHTLLTVTTFAAGALLGDLGKSFVKRRIGKGQGEPWPVADQYDLVAGAFLLTALLAPRWLLGNITLPILVSILVLTPLLHRVTNIAGHRLGVKRVPW